jgi:uncharacterized membrane protein required for colicin V production
MNWFDFLVLIILAFSLVGGVIQGAVKAASSLASLIIALPLTAYSYHWLASLLSFLPGEDWPNFLGFFITLGVIIVVIQLILFLPRKLIGKIWTGGIFFRLLGGIFGLLGSCIGWVVFATVVQANPIFDWMAGWLSGSNVISSLVTIFSFIQPLLPEAFRAS